MKAALAAGADVNSRGAGGESDTPLFCALDTQDGVDQAMVTLLIAAGADTKGALSHASELHFHPDVFYNVYNDIGHMADEELRTLHKDITELEMFLLETLGDKSDKARVAKLRKRSAAQLEAARAEWERPFRADFDAAQRERDARKSKTKAKKRPAGAKAGGNSAKRGRSA